MKRLSTHSERFGLADIGRRSCPRLRLRAPAKLQSVIETQACLLVNVSLSGALVRLPRPLAVNACGYLRAGAVEAFSIIVRTDTDNEHGGFAAVKFDVPLRPEQLSDLDVYAREHERIDREALRRAALDWVSGAKSC